MKKEQIIEELDVNEIKHEVRKKTLWAKILPFLSVILDVLIDKLLDAILTKYKVTKK